MSNNNLKDIEKEKKLYKKAALYGAIGVGLTYTYCIASNNTGTEFLLKSFQNMTLNETLCSITLGVSLLGGAWGGLMYGVSSYLDSEDKRNEENKINEINKISQVNKKSIEEKLRD